MNMKRFLAFALTLCMLISLVPMVPARAAEDETLDFEELDGTQLNLDIQNPNMDDSLVLEDTFDENEMVKVIVVMEEESILAGNSQAVLTAGVQNKMDAMEYQQNVIVAQIEEDVMDGDEIQVDYHYTWLVNGFATTIPYGTIETIEALTGVERVVIQEVYSVCETTNAVAAPNTITDGVMIGRESAWANGYTGEGMKIAIIDTGLDTDHPNFAPLGEDKLTDTSASADTVAAVLENLNASKRYEGLSIADVYYSSKVVFGFNYCDNDLDITHDYDGVSDHGTHVAGIAAANKIDGSEVVGVAPDAQLYIMKVFGKNGGAYTADILAALEDALMLGADVINMSLGSPAGFTTSGDEYLDSVYAGVASTGTVLSVSAGNNYTSGYGNFWGTNLNQTMYPDNGVGGQPGTYANTMTVASVENWKIQRNYIDAEGYQLTYVDAALDFNLPSLLTLTGEYEFVVVPGNGEPADYEGLDVAGKVALVQRGVTSFVEKHEYAASAGAIACLIYNNVSGEFAMNMTDTAGTIPVASITMADGAYLAANPGLKLSFPEDLAAFPSATAYQMSDFSSQGPAPDLTLNPDITAPGGNIYSTIKDGQYGLMSGTSMAAPNIAGMTALVMQYVKETFPEGTDYRAVTQALLMSTSVPLEYAEGVAYSPRVQGSGLANVFNAITTNAYLSVDGADNAKADVGDDAGRTGVYTFSFNVHNFGANAAFYELGTTVQTEDVTDIEGYYFMSGTPLDLGSETEETSDSLVFTHDVDNDGDTDSHDAYYIYQAAQKTPVESGWEAESFRYDVNADEAVANSDVQAYLDALVGKTSDADLEDTVLMVASGETAVIDVTVTLGEDEKAYFDTYYPNGGYVEGFTTLTALHAEGVDLSLPYLAFYGDWGEAPALDDGDYISYINEGYAGNQHFHALYSQLDGEEFGICPGLNPYVEAPVDPENISLSPNGDGMVDSITDVGLSLLRNASYLELRFTNVDTGEILFQAGGSNATKTVFNFSYGQIVPFYYADYDMPELPDFEGLENNTKVLFEAEVVGMDPDAEPEIWSVPITIDLEAPELLSVKRSEDLNTGAVTLDLVFKDNVSAAACLLADGLGQYALAISGVEALESDENGNKNYTVSFDITELSGKVMVILSDYAMNQSYYGVNLGGEGTPYGDLVAYQYNYYTGTNGWVSFDSDVDMDETGIFASFDMDFVAAEYVGGFVYAQTDTGALYGFAYADMLTNTVDLEDVYITQLDNVYQDFAYSYAEGKLFGLYTYVDDYGYPTSEINSINLRGAYFDEDMYMDVAPFQEDWFAQRGGVYGLTLAIDGEGTMYVLGPNYDYETESLTETAHLWSAIREEYVFSWGSYVDYYFEETGDTGMTMDYLQSMTWDHNTNKLYWARFNAGATYLDCELIEIDPTNVEEITDEEGYVIGNKVSATKVGTLSGETCALFAPLTEETAAKEPYTNVPEMDKSVIGTPVLRDAAVTMSLGGTKTLGCDFDPWYTDHKELVWSTSDETVVTVDENGTITAVGAGSATITAANKADESKYDTVTVEVTALDLVFEGVVSAQTAGTGATAGTSTYKFQMVEGLSSFGTVNAITATEELNYGLSLATSEMGRGSIWACEYGNTGMIYEIDPATGAVKDVFNPIDGDMMFGLHYSDSLDSFTGIMNFFLYVDIPMNHEMYEEMQNSYDEEQAAFMWHRINMLPYLEEANGGFITGETGQGASSEIVFCGITGIEGGMKDAWGETYYYDSYKDYMGNWAFEGSVNYQPTQTLVLLDNVGRLWYIDEIAGMTKTTDEYGNAFYTSADGMSNIEHYGQHRNGMFEVEYGVNEDGSVNCSVFNIRQVVDTALTDMFRDGSMPRITYHFSDIELAGYTAEGDPMFAISLYDYWNNGTTNELYLLIPGRETEDWDYETNSAIRTPDRLFALGNTGENNIIASIHFAEVTGGLDAEEDENAEVFSVNKLAAGLYKQQ